MKAFFELAAFILGQQSLGRQHAGVCDRATNVLPKEPLVIRNALGESLNLLVGSLRKHAAP
jgi:hypothetical protein